MTIRNKVNHMSTFDQNAFNKRIQNLLIADSDRYKTILRYFETRKRSERTDVNQLAVYIKSFAKEHGSLEITNDHIGIFLHILADYKIGEFEKEKGKYKFKWYYRIFPVFDRNGRLKSVAVKDLNSDFNPDDVNRLDISQKESNQSAANRSSISEMPLEELIQEFNRRGFKISLEPIK